MDRETYRMCKGETVREWCERNNNYNIIENWDYEKNGNITPDNVARFSRMVVHFKCHVCGNVFSQKLIYAKRKTGCLHCRGNKHVDLGRNGDYTVYCHITPDGKKYVGFTGEPLCKRFANGKLYPTKRFSDAIRKYGWKNIEHIVLESGLTKEEASEKEIYYINFYNTLDERYGYNISTGGIHGYHEITRTEEIIKKIAKSNTGKKRSLATRAKISESHKGLDNHQSKEIYKLDRDGHILHLYSSAKEAAEDNNCTLNDISRCAVGHRKTCRGFVWKYKCDMEVKNE